MLEQYQIESITFIYSHAMKSSFLDRPIFASPSATLLEALPLWQISTWSPDDEMLRIKLRMNWIFHGLPDRAQHQPTTFFESDSMIIFLPCNPGLPWTIFNALWIAKTSAMLISIWGIGDENIHRNFPSESPRTPPIDVLIRIGCNEASTFHLMQWDGGGTHKEADGSGMAVIVPGTRLDQRRHWGARTISSGE